ncbi:accessory gene regulator B family protein [Paenibacillus nasutitermitis]|uniref:Accessory regulator AgrB n=1 Tax=Paenibacillus nasutitermitis TaxID=1652958 RepID=A0A917DRL7_9BACL|nr:accessory gene regulator B family protein [Paenibacillus nasutitermitis]GGD64396.1 hypothetical protein GCM10010911_22680 [Paenibacillus nasutitermitis]
MINALSHKLAVGIKSKVPDHPASIAVLQYSLSMVLNTVFILGLSFLISLFTGRSLETLVALAGFAALRQISGGYHLKSGIMCILVSTAGITAITFADFGSLVTLILNAGALLLALVFAPSRIDRQTRIPKEYFGYLKLGSMALIVISGFVGYSVLAAAFFVQALTLIRTRR